MGLDELELVSFDCEVFAEDWLFCFEPVGGEPVAIWSDRGALEEYLGAHEGAVYVGFNCKRYDACILKAVLAGCSPPEVREVSDFIVSGQGMGWEHPYLKGFYHPLRQADLMDDTMRGTSLKAIEGHLGMSIEESSVPFDVGRALTEAERAEVERYCLYDVRATARLMEVRRGYLETKMHLAELGGLDPVWALSQTEPMLAAAFMGAERGGAPSDDERDYEFPERLDYSYVPDEVVGFFERIRDESVGDEELFSSKLAVEMGGCELTYAWGGVHGALPRHSEGSGKGRVLLNYDVASLYPSLMIGYGYVSRAVPDPQAFADVRDERMEAKGAGDKRTADALKSPLNKGYGAMLNEHNPMYDPKMARSVCISGQLSMTVLASAYARVPGLHILQGNTDGIMMSVPEGSCGDVQRINEWWQAMTGLALEEDRIRLLRQKDVSNYALLKEDGTEKVKGAYLARGVSAVGAWSINNNATIVAEAVKRRLLYGTPVAETILACDDPFAFQLIAKAGSKYERVYQLVGGEEVPVQRCNRVFATADERFGRLYKVKRADGSVAKVESLPEHCLVSNAGMAPIEAIDKQWYVALAERRALEFEPKGDAMTEEKGAAKAATKPRARKKAESERPPMNLYQKLALARKMFADAGVEKSGYNDSLNSEYFTLDDIAPVQTEIFAELGLLEHFTYVPPIREVVTGPDGCASAVEVTPPYAQSAVYDADDPAQVLVFRAKWAELPPQLSNQGKRVTHELMEIGKAQTYLRRYLKQQILDVVEVDAVEEERPEAPEPAKAAEPKPKGAKPQKAAAGDAKVAAPKGKPKRPAGEGRRKQLAEAATGAGGQADDLMRKQVLRAMRRLKEELEGTPEADAWRASVGQETDNLAQLSRERAEELLAEAAELRERFAGAEGSGR